RRVGRRALGDGPRQHRALVLEAEVVVQVAGPVLLDDELQRPGARLARAAWRLRGDVEAPLAVVLGQHAVLAEVGLALGAHGLIVPTPSARSRARGESAEVRLRAATLGLDREAGRLHRPLGVAIGMT